MNIDFAVNSLAKRQTSLSIFDTFELLPRATSGSGYTHPPSAPSFPQADMNPTFIQPTDNDIILGRGKIAFNHVGNRRYRNIIDQNGALYQSLKPRDAKTRMTGEIINLLRSNGSRFLQWNKETGLYEEVDDVHEKVSHALRSSHKPKNKRSTNGGGAGGCGSRNKLPTPEENRTFGLLYHEQQRVLQELLEKYGMEEEEAGAA